MNPITTLRKLIRSKPIVDNLEREVKSMNPTNWRTTLHGIAAGVLMLASIWAPAEWHDRIEGTAGAFVMMGLISAADSKNLHPPK